MWLAYFLIGYLLLLLFLFYAGNTTILSAKSRFEFKDYAFLLLIFGLRRLLVMFSR